MKKRPGMLDTRSFALVVFEKEEEEITLLLLP
jgi:hypothetical protein